MQSPDLRKKKLQPPEPINMLQDTRVLKDQYQERIIEERKQRKQQVGEKKTPFTKFDIKKNTYDSDSIEDPDEDEQEMESQDKYLFNNFNRPNVKKMNDGDLINDVVGSVKKQGIQPKFPI